MVRVGEREGSEYDSTFTDAEEETGSDAAGRSWRQQSVPEMLKAAQEGKEPRNKRQRHASGKTGKPGEGPEITLDAIEALIQAGNVKVIQTIEARFSSVDKRLEILEGQLFEKNAKVEGLEKELHELRKQN